MREDELDILMPACIEMFTEEVGVSPTTGSDGSLYRARVRELVASGRAIARIENGQVLFKAELGSVSSQVCQVQGVWVRPDLRGQGLSAPGMASVVRYARERFAPTVSLYVNGYNEPATTRVRARGVPEHRGPSPPFCSSRADAARSRCGQRGTARRLTTHWLTDRQSSVSRSAWDTRTHDVT